MISKSRAMRTGALGMRIRSLESALATRQAIAGSQAVRQQYSAFSRSSPFSRYYPSTPSSSTLNSVRQSAPYNRTGPAPTRYYSSTPTANILRPPAALNETGSASTRYYSLTPTPSTLNSGRSLQSLRNQNPSIGSSVTRRTSTKLLPNNTYDNISNPPSYSSRYASMYKSRSGQLPPTPVDNKKLTKAKRVKKWIRKHKTPLILTGAGIAVPAAIGGGLQADGEARQDIRDANMLEANKSLLLQPLPSGVESFSFFGGDSGGSGQRRSWVSKFRDAPAILDQRQKSRTVKFRDTSTFAKQRQKPKQQRKTVKKPKKKQKRVAVKKGKQQVKVGVTKKTAKGKITKCIKQLGKCLLEYKKLKSGVTAAYLPVTSKNSNSRKKLKYKQLSSGIDVAYPAF